MEMQSVRLMEIGESMVAEIVGYDPSGDELVDIEDQLSDRYAHGEPMRASINDVDVDFGLMDWVIAAD
jgi:hypothetical protein